MEILMVIGTKLVLKDRSQSDWPEDTHSKIVGVGLNGNMNLIKVQDDGNFTSWKTREQILAEYDLA